MYDAVGVNIRTAPSTGCTSVGVGYSGHWLTLHCIQVGYDNFLWDYLTDNTTGKTGWSRDSYVSWTGGPLVGC